VPYEHLVVPNKKSILRLGSIHSFMAFLWLNRSKVVPKKFLELPNSDVIFGVTSDPKR
jgi:hypothetical protein